MLRVIAPKHLDERSRAGVANEISGEYLTVEFFAAIEPCEKDVQTQVQQGIINLRWVDRSGGSIGRMCGVGRRISYCPGQGAFAPITTAVQQATDSAEDISESDARGHDVR